MGQDDLCEVDEFCVFTGGHRDKTALFECIKKLVPGMYCEAHSWCLYADCVIDNLGAVGKCAPER